MASEAELLAEITALLKEWGYRLSHVGSNYVITEIKPSKGGIRQQTYASLEELLGGVDAIVSGGGLGVAGGGKPFVPASTARKIIDILKDPATPKDFFTGIIDFVKRQMGGEGNGTSPVEGEEGVSESGQGAVVDNRSDAQLLYEYLTGEPWPPTDQYGDPDSAEMRAWAKMLEGTEPAAGTYGTSAEAQAAIDADPALKGYAPKYANGQWTIEEPETKPGGDYVKNIGGKDYIVDEYGRVQREATPADKVPGADYIKTIGDKDYIVDEYGRVQREVTKESKTAQQVMDEAIANNDFETYNKIFDIVNQLDPWQKAQLAEKSLDQLIADAAGRNDVDTVNRLTEIQGRMSQYQGADIGLRQQAEDRAQRQQALDIAQSPGDLYTYLSRLRGNQPNVDFTLGARAIPGYAGGLLGMDGQQGGEQGVINPATYNWKPNQQIAGFTQTGIPHEAYRANPQDVASNMARYQAELDAQREQRGSDGLTLEERIRRQAGLQSSTGENINPPSSGQAQPIGGTLTRPQVLSAIKSGTMSLQQGTDMIRQGMLAAGWTPEAAASTAADIVGQWGKAGLIGGQGQSSGAVPNPYQAGELRPPGAAPGPYQPREGQGTYGIAPGPYAPREGQGMYGIAPAGTELPNYQQADRMLGQTLGGGSPNQIVPLGGGQATGNQYDLMRDTSGTSDVLNAQMKQVFGEQSRQLSGQGTNASAQAIPSGTIGAQEIAQDPNNPNMIAIKDRTGKVHWVNKYDTDSINFFRNWSGPTSLPASPIGGASTNLNVGPSANFVGNPALTPGLKAAFSGGQPGQSRLAPSMGAPPFLSAQTLGQMTPSEQDIYGAEIKAQGFYPKDYEWQRQRQFGGFSGGTAGGGGGGYGRTSMAARAIR